MPRLAVALCIRGKFQKPSTALLWVQFMVSCQSSHFPKRYFDTVGTIFAKRCQCWQPNGSQVGTPNSLKPIRGPLCFFRGSMLVFKMSLKLLPLPLGWRCCWSSYKPWGIHGWWKPHLLHVYCCIPGYSGLSIWSKIGGSDTWMNSCYFTICEPCTKCYLCLPTTPKHLQCVVLAEVYRIRFWMRHYGSASMKRPN